MGDLRVEEKVFVEAEEGQACMLAWSPRRPGLEQEVMPLVEQGVRGRAWQGWGLAGMAPGSGPRAAQGAFYSFSVYESPFER